MAFVQYDQVIQALPPDGPNDSLGLGVLPGGLGCGQDLANAHRLELQG